MDREAAVAAHSLLRSCAASDLPALLPELMYATLKCMRMAPALQPITAGRFGCPNEAVRKNGRTTRDVARGTADRTTRCSRVSRLRVTRGFAVDRTRTRASVRRWLQPSPRRRWMRCCVLLRRARLRGTRALRLRGRSVC